MTLRFALMLIVPTLGIAGSVDDFPRVAPEIHARLYEQLELIHQACTKSKIKYWLIGGSLLGQVRGEFLGGRGEIIPWDDDADIGIDVKDKARFLLAVGSVAPQAQMALWNSSHGFKLRCTRTKGIGTDVFFYQKVSNYTHPTLNDSVKEPIWVLATEASRKAWPSDFFLDHELRHLKLAKFGNLKLTIPSKPMRYLETLYGSNCMSVARLGYNHSADKPHDNAGTTAPLNATKSEL